MASQNDGRSPLIEKILDAAIRQNVSDIHLTIGLPPVLRIHGDLRPLETAVLNPEDTQSYMKSLTAIAGSQFELELQSNGSCNFSFDKSGRAFRVNICAERRGYSLVLRLISGQVKKPQELGIAPSVLKAVRKDHGLVLVTGATGSGKSTTLASLIDDLTRERALRVVTVEQPIEYRFEHNRSVVTQREVPLHTRDCGDALNDALRQDPDVIFVGELRTRHEMEVALKASETGHIVFSTLHTNTAKDAIDRIVLMFPEGEQPGVRMVLSMSLLAILSQTLVPTIDGQGRVMVHEVLINNPAIGNLIREGKTERMTSSIQTGAKHGMLMFDDHLWERYAAGLISKESALSAARDQEGFARRIIRGGTLESREE